MDQTVIQKKRFQAVNLFTGAIKNLRYYPPSSDMAVGSVDRAYTSLIETLDQAGPVIFTVSTDHLSISDCPLTEKEQQSPHIRSLFEIMTYWGIRRITLERDLQKSDLMRFLDAFKKTPDEIENDGGRKELILNLPSAHIIIESPYLTGPALEKPDPAADALRDPSSLRPIQAAATEETLHEKLQRIENLKQRSANRIDDAADLFADPDLLSMVPEIIVSRILEENVESARALLEKVGTGLSDGKTEIQDAAAHTLTLAGNRLAVENRLDPFIEVLPRLTQWVRSQTVLTPTAKGVCRQLQLAATHHIQARRFESALPILETLGWLSRLKSLDDTLSGFADEMLKTVAETENLHILSEGILKYDPPDSDHAGSCLILLGVHSGAWLLDILSSASERSQRIRVMATLTEIGRPILPMIQKRISQEGPWYFLRNLTLLLGKCGDETYLDTVTPLLEHEDIRVRREALNTLYNIGGSRRRSLLLSALGSTDEHLKMSIVIMLGGLRHPEAVGPLLGLLKDHPLIPSQTRVQMEEAICKALGRIGDPQALPLLREILDPKGIKRVTPYGESVKASAKEALMMIEKHQARPESDNPMDAPESDSRSSDTTMPSENGLLEIQKQVDAYIQQGDKAAAVSFLLHRVERAALTQQFQKAETLLEKMSEVDPMALSEIDKAGELLEAEKTAALDKDRMASWGGLYDTLTREETNALYFALKEHHEKSDVVLIQQGRENDTLFFIEQGAVKVVFEKNQHEYLIKRLKGGDVAGTESFFNPTLSTVSVITQTAVRLNVLNMEGLDRFKVKTPALENKLRDFCVDKNNITRTLLEKSIERRVYARNPMEGIITIQLLHVSGTLSGKAFKGRLTDLSAGGLCFSIKLQNRESARILLGRKLHLNFPLFAERSETLSHRTGTVVAVHYSLSIDYLVHVRFDDPIDLTKP